MLQKNKNTIMITHTDMDGESCLMLARQYFKNILPFRISYSNILKTLKEIKDTNSSQLIITDLNFSKEDYEALLEIIPLFENVLYIDHHIYDYEFKEKENLKVIINSKYCATALLYGYMLRYKEFKFNKELVSLVNTYDLWKYKSSKFKEAHGLNLLFWYYGAKRFNNIFSNTQTITPSQYDRIQSIKDNIHSYFKENEEKGLIIHNPDMCISFLDENIGEIKFHYNSLLYVNLRDSFHFSVRIDDDMELDKATILRDLILENTPNNKLINKGGHIYAFGITCERLELHEIKEYIESFQYSFKEFERQTTN